MYCIEYQSFSKKYKQKQNKKENAAILYNSIYKTNWIPGKQISKHTKSVINNFIWKHLFTVIFFLTAYLLNNQNY